MKFRVTMKDPDTLGDAIREAVKKQVAEIDILKDSEKELVEEQRVEEISDIAGQWFEYGEYLTIEIDTETLTAVVIAKGK